MPRTRSFSQAFSITSASVMKARTPSTDEVTDLGQSFVAEPSVADAGAEAWAAEQARFCGHRSARRRMPAWQRRRHTRKRLASATLDLGDGTAHVLERIYVYGTAEEEIRWCYYKNGGFVTRPPDLPEEDLLRLFEAAVTAGVFTPRFQQQLKEIL